VGGRFACSNREQRTLNIQQSSSILKIAWRVSDQIPGKERRATRCSGMMIVDSLSYFQATPPRRRSSPFRRGRREPDAAQIELARLKLVHEQLRRYAADLKVAYQAERARRLALSAELIGVTQATLELVSRLSGEEPGDRTAKQAA
jgi:hypothetical protein